MSREVVVFERFDKYLHSSQDTRLGVTAVYRFPNGYGAEISRTIFVKGVELGLWRVKLLGPNMGCYPKKRDAKLTEWLNAVFSFQCNQDSDLFSWNLSESNVEVILDEIKSIREPILYRIRRFFSQT